LSGFLGGFLVMLALLWVAGAALALAAAPQPPRAA